jgi:CheY-like chemotaxis protein
MRDSIRSSHRAPSRKLKILLVDDNEVLLVAIRGLLRLMGHATDVARNGREALEARSRHKYDVVLLDVQMPEMGGYEAARALRSDFPVGTGPLIIGFSGEPADRESYDASGMDDFLVKPVQPKDLERILRPLLEARDCGVVLARDLDHKSIA